MGVQRCESKIKFWTPAPTTHPGRRNTTRFTSRSRRRRAPKTSTKSPTTTSAAGTKTQKVETPYEKLRKKKNPWQREGKKHEKAYKHFQKLQKAANRLKSKAETEVRDLKKEIKDHTTVKKNLCNTCQHGNRNDCKILSDFGKAKANAQKRAQVHQSKAQQHKTSYNKEFDECINLNRKLRRLRKDMRKI